MRDQYYYLPPHVYACRTDEGVVFLDAKRDRYFGIGGAGVAALPAFIENWAGHSPYAHNAGEISISDVEVQRVAADLIQRGLLQRCGEEGNLTHHTSAPPLVVDQPQSVVAANQSLRLIDFFYFTVACLQALWLLKRLPLEMIAQRVVAARRYQRPLNFAGVFARVQVFRRLRRLFFSEKDRCLLNALSLIIFLRRYGYFPLLVIGVKTRPFAAHSWVQHEQVLLEGDPASVCHFTPILVA